MPEPKRSAQRKPSSPPQSVEVVDPRWLLKMLGLAIVAAVICGYLAMGFLVRQGAWQLVLHPTRNANSGTGLVSEKVEFGPDAAGKPQLHGEWLAADASSPRAAYAVLYLRGTDGQLDSADGSQIATLRQQGLNVLAFDYRGYGASAERPHPEEQRMLEDATAAWNYLTGLRHIDPRHILVFGNGIGVSLGAQLLANSGPGAALIGYNADSSVVERVRHDGRVRLYPLALVFHDSFSLEPLKHLTIPKLLYTVGPLDTQRIAAYASATDPKLTVEVPSHEAAAEEKALKRFLDSLLPGAPIPILTPNTK